MIELRTNTDFLDRLAAEETQAGRDGNGTDIKAAALDHRNLQEYAERLESNIQKMSGEIQSIRTQRDEAAAALLAIFRPELERMIDAAIEQCRPLEDLRERVERLEDDDDKANDIREEVRDMIRDGELVVELKNANSW
jgi:predicted  nucleic acid-binding Zn-ribbon protein